MKYSKLFTALLILTVFTLSTQAQFGLKNEIVKIRSYQSMDKYYPSGEFLIAVEVDILGKWHINSDKPNEEYFIPTSLTISESPEFTIQKIVYPDDIQFKSDFSKIPLSVWEGKIYIGSVIRVNDNLLPGKYKMVVNLEYQACNDKSCLAPSIISDTITIHVADKKDVVNQINQDIFNNIDLSLTELSSTGNNSDINISSILEENGILLGLIFVFLGGLALNLTPCVYPLIPITIGYFGGQSEGNTRKLVVMGILFVLGLAITYSVIGVITSLTGAIFGALLQSPVVILIVALILIALSLSMFGVYQFKFPDKWVTKAGGARGGFYGAFFMGITLGIVAAPCIGPFVIGLVTFVATKQDPMFGFLMFFVLAVGLGTPYLFLAVFSGKIKSLPRAGEWMIGVEHIFGLILVGMAIYFILPLLPDDVSGFILPVYMVLTGIYILFFEKNARSIIGFKIFKTVFSILIIGIAVYNLIPSDSKSISWKTYSDTAVTNINSKGVIIDFYADWCIPCKELDAVTFSDPRVVEMSKEFDNYKADFTKSLDPEVEKLRDKYEIVGVPTILVLNSMGEEKQRITGFVNADEFIKLISNID